jgi:hypothetical protein
LIDDCLLGGLIGVRYRAGERQYSAQYQDYYFHSSSPVSDFGTVRQDLMPCRLPNGRQV